MNGSIHLRKMDAPSTLSTPVCTTMKAKIMTGSDRTAMQDGWAKLNGQDRTRAVSEADGTGPDQWPVLAVGYGHVEVAAEKVALCSTRTPGGRDKSAHRLPNKAAATTLSKEKKSSSRHRAVRCQTSSPSAR